MPHVDCGGRIDFGVDDPMVAIHEAVHRVGPTTSCACREGGKRVMKIVVFGAAGWVGRAIVENLGRHHQVRACDRSPEAWDAGKKIDGEWRGGEIINGDISDYETADEAIEGMDAVVHAAVYFSGAPGAYGVDDDIPFLVNLKGLYNVLEAARTRQIRRVVHIGSCPVVHPDGVFFSAEVRRPDGGLYAVSKRLQEEMCRQFHDAFGMSIVVLRPCSIVDLRLGIDKLGTKLEPGSQIVNWVCRHDLAEANRLAVEKAEIGLEVLSIAGSVEAEQHCNVRRARQVLGLEFEGDLDPYR